MRALQLFGLVALAAASEESCLPAGKVDTILNLEGASLSLNNMGGFGTGGGVEAMILSNAGTAGSEAGIYAGQPFDIMITNTSEYMPINYGNTKINGQFAQINMAPPSVEDIYPVSGTTENVGKFKICAVASGTGTSGSPTLITLDSLPLTFYDL
tara:strand:+ start:134 stop:598 length:465 start_codon:yes stop_codon:yes gene_type:complete